MYRHAEGRLIQLLLAWTVPVSSCFSLFTLHTHTENQARLIQPDICHLLISSDTQRNKRKIALVLSLIDMSCLLHCPNRSYWQFHLLWRHLPTLIIERHQSNHILLIISSVKARRHINSGHDSRLDTSQKRTIKIHAPFPDDKPASTVRETRLPLDFPPGKPTDKPTIEHLRFIENQLTQIVSRQPVRCVDTFMLLSSYLSSAIACIPMRCTPVI